MRVQNKAEQEPADIVTLLKMLLNFRPLHF